MRQPYSLIQIRQHLTKHILVFFPTPYVVSLFTLWAAKQLRQRQEQEAVLLPTPFSSSKSTLHILRARSKLKAGQCARLRLSLSWDNALGPLATAIGLPAAPCSTMPGCVTGLAAPQAAPERVNTASTHRWHRYDRSQLHCSSLCLALRLQSHSSMASW